jgi:hypothetical protein
MPDGTADQDAVGQSAQRMQRHASRRNVHVQRRSVPIVDDCHSRGAKFTSDALSTFSN